MVKYTVMPYYGFWGNVKHLTRWWWRKLLFRLRLRCISPLNPFEHITIVLSHEAFKPMDIILTDRARKFKIIRKHES